MEIMGNMVNEKNMEDQPMDHRIQDYHMEDHRMENIAVNIIEHLRIEI
jgi:hypothetical protein